MDKQMPSKFATAFAAKLKEKGIKPIELEKLSGVTRQNISRLLNDTPHPVSGAPPKTKKATIEKIAKPLDWNVDEALTLAGLGEANNTRIPESIAYAIEQSKSLSEIDYELTANFIKMLDEFKGSKTRSNVHFFPQSVPVPNMPKDLDKEDLDNIKTRQQENRKGD
jgi:transcriptional regulator with XRE-family HTH domain